MDGAEDFDEGEGSCGPVEVEEGGEAEQLRVGPAGAEGEGEPGAGTGEEAEDGQFDGGDAHAECSG